VSRQIALLRAINVGGHVVKMDRLRALFESMKLTDVATVIASGNVLFSSRATDRARLERRIETHLHDALGYEVAAFLRSAEDLADIVAHRPFPDAPPLAVGHALSVAFLKEPLEASARAALLALHTATDAFHVHGREAYWVCRGRISDSKVTGAKLEKAVAGLVTVRNITTVRKLAITASR
jgi:uncharacterized protein (DUF1697 family)